MSTTQPIRSREELENFKRYYETERTNERNYMLIVMGLNTALRISDILQLTYGDVYDYTKGEWKRYLCIDQDDKDQVFEKIQLQNTRCIKNIS